MLADCEESRGPRQALLALVPRRVCTLHGVSGGAHRGRSKAEAAPHPHVAGRGIHPVEVGQAAGLTRLGPVLRAWRVGLAGGLRAGAVGPGSVGLDLLTRELV